MKKAMMLLAAAAGAVSGFAAVVKTTWVDFGTTGPDVYADGSPVAVGAEYWLLFVPDGRGLSDGRVCATALATALVDGGAHCPLTTFQYPRGAAEFAGGSFVTVLADGSVGAVTIIARQMATTDVLTGQTLAAAGTAPDMGAADSVAATGEAPKIVSMSVKDGCVLLTVSGLCVGTYSVERGTLGGAWAPTGYGFASCVKGAPAVTVVLPVEADATAAFYRVVAR